MTWIKTTQQNNPTATDNTPTLTISSKLPLQFIWDNNSSGLLFKENLRSINLQRKLEQLVNSNFPTSKEGVNKFSNQFQDVILDAAKKSLEIKKTKFKHKITNVCNKKWFDKGCRLKRDTVRNLANQEHRDPLNPELRNEYHNALKIYKDTLRRKKEIFQEQKLDELQKALDSGPNSFWKTLKNISDSYDESFSNSSHIIDHKWLSHFESLHSKHILGSESSKIL